MQTADWGCRHLSSAAVIGEAVSGISERRAKVIKMRDRLIDGILSSIPDTRLNGDRVSRLEGNGNIAINGIEGESLLMLLDMEGICASSGSACESSSLDPSHVLKSIGLEENNDEDIDYILTKLPAIVKRLRELS